MDFPIATRIPSFENSFCNYMFDSIITVHGQESSPTHTGDLQSVLLYAKSWSDEVPRKTCHIIQEPTDNVRSSFKITWTFRYKSVSVSIRNWICKCIDKLQVTADTFCRPSVNLLWKIIWVWHVFLVEVCIIRPLVWYNDTWN
jgi:hypothetical protein